ncbi:MAG: hypothetical protein K8R92_07485 [Planctomycetes bacterium]|nr:hypothetical protein [Planctomycetota bacterium]
MLSPMRTIDALWQLARLGAILRFRFHGAYWKWRRETAFGAAAERMPPRLARWRAVLEYGAWVGRMRRLAARDS